MIRTIRQLRKIHRILFVDEPLGAHLEPIQAALGNEPVPVGKTVIVVSATAVERYVFGRESDRYSEWLRKPFTHMHQLPRTFLQVV